MASKRFASRRDFLATGIAASAALALPTIIPATAIGRDGRPAPSERIVLGCIGTGGQGRGLMNMFMRDPAVQIVAVCDVDNKHCEAARDMANGKYGNKDCKTFKDFRELLELSDVNAVSIATPDHWHALATVAAANAGKHIYCEKPLANSVAEGRAMVEAAKKNNVLLQCGSHERSNSSARFGCELVRNGRIGKLQEVRVQMPSDQAHHNKVKAFEGIPTAQPVPEGFDYDMWLGHTPKADYSPERTHFWWRFILAYGGGEMTDRGAHIIDLGQLGANKDATGPVKITAKGSRKEGSLYDAFMDYSCENTYDDGLKLTIHNEGPRGVKFIGDDGWLFIEVHGGKLSASNADILKEDAAKFDVQLGRTSEHRQNFLDVVKDPNEELMAPGEVGHRTATICHLNNIAMMVGRDLTWDPAKEQIVGDDEASALLTPSMRKPWSL